VAQQAAVPAAAAFDIVVRFLRVALRTLFVVGLVVAVGAWLAGPSPAAVQVRSTAARGVAALRRGAIATWLSEGPVGPWVHGHRVLLRVVVVVIGVLVLLFLDRPTGLDVLGIAVLVVVLLGVIEFLDQPGAPPAGTEAALAGSTGTGDGGEVAARAP
jgi:hypothetical protein